jgi:putative ABC transport system permease protein
MRVPQVHVPEELQPKLALGETLSFALDTFRQNKVRFALTALGMVIGTASLILVTTIGLTGKQYLLNQIEAIGANQVLAEYDGATSHITAVARDPLTIDDMRAVREQVPGITVASPVIPLNERVPIGEGRERELQILGVNPEYQQVRNLVVLAGRFFDNEDSTARNKVGLITLVLAKQLYGSPEAAIGKTLKLSGLPFVIVGVFKEGVETFGQTEISDNSMVIPYTVSRFFTQTDEVKQLYFSMADGSMVIPATDRIRRVIGARHRPESVYSVHNLTQLITLADQTATVLTIVLLLIALVVLLVSGIGIMNIMLSTVNARIREIGVRKAIGATTREIRFQFLAEAVLISLIGGFIGIVIGMAIPFALRFLFDFHIPISGLSAIIAIVVSTLVGIIFGTVPATRAAQADPVESLRYE